jgi:hypothetical protein
VHAAVADAQALRHIALRQVWVLFKQCQDLVLNKVFVL